jgi:hypothetical protein
MGTLSMTPFGVGARIRLATLASLVLTVVALRACVGRLAAAPPPVILVDEAHGEKFLVEANGALDLSSLAGAWRAAGATVEPSTQPLTEVRLSHADALVVSGAFAPFSATEIAAVMHFLDRGGRLAVMLHIPFPLTPLLRRLRVDFSNGVIREREHVAGGDPKNFQLTVLSPHPLTRRVDALSVYGAWALMNENADAAIIARTGPSAWVDLNGNDRLDAGDAVQSFGVAVAGHVGQGEFVVFGDDAIFQNQFLSKGNAVLARNLGCWLTRASCQADRAT